MNINVFWPACFFFNQSENVFVLWYFYTLYIFLIINVQCGICKRRISYDNVCKKDMINVPVQCKQKFVFFIDWNLVSQKFVSENVNTCTVHMCSLYYFIWVPNLFVNKTKFFNEMYRSCNIFLATSVIVLNFLFPNCT